MGCDIHMYIEVKIEGQWHYYGEANIKRNYNLFSRLAGARLSERFPPIVAPRGVPDDLSAVTRMHLSRWESDAHTESWLSHDEMMKVYGEFDNDDWCDYDKNVPFTVYLLGNCVTDYKDEDYEDSYSDIENMRFVFWFDN